MCAREYLESLTETFALTEIDNNALKLGKSDFFSGISPFIELRSHIGARVSQGADFGVQRILVVPMVPSPVDNVGPS